MCWCCLSGHQIAKVLHLRACRAKKKHQKTKELLQEVIVPPNQLSLTCNNIDSEIIVFDSGDTTSPQIKPPAGIQWRCISIRMLHVYRFGFSKDGWGLSLYSIAPSDVAGNNCWVWFRKKYQITDRLQNAPTYGAGSWWCIPCLHRLWEVCYLCLCWSSALPKLEDHSKPSSLYASSAQFTLEDTGVDDETWQK